MSKEALRRDMRRARRRLRGDERRRANLAIARNLTALQAWQQAGVVALFAASKEEVATSSLIDLARTAGKQVVLPRVAERDAPLVWHDPAPPGRAFTLVDGDFGIQEPPASAPVVAPDAIDLYVVPALAVDGAGYRVGYGGGYYDRTLALAREDAVLVCVHFALQRVDAVPHEAFDVPLHWLVSEVGAQQV